MRADVGRDSLSIDRHRGRRSQSSSIAGERKKSHLFEKVMDTAFWLRDVPEKALLEGERGGEKELLYHSSIQNKKKQNY